MIALGGRTNGQPRETGFDITAASEVMALMAVTRDLADLRERLGKITIGYSREGKAITAEDLGAAGAMTVLLKDALKPNLVQTLEGQPCLMHTGPFANIASGNNSLVADRIGMKVADYIVTESGFGADMGMEKFFDIVCRFGDLTPSAVVLVCTVRAIRHHAGGDDGDLEEGFANVAHHLQTIKKFGLPAVVAVNRRPGRLRRGRRGRPPARAERRRARRRDQRGLHGGRQGRRQARRGRRRRVRRAERLQAAVPRRGVDRGQDRGGGHGGLRRRRRDLLPASRSRRSTSSRRTASAHFPVCMAKTQLSLTADPKLLGAPKGFEIHVRDIRAYTGAGWLVPLCGDIMQMPGLGAKPAALNIDIDSDGNTVGLF